MLHIARQLAGLWTLTSAAVAASALAAADTSHHPPPVLYRGVPRDIDYIDYTQAHTQVVLHGGPTDELIAFTDHQAIARIALLGLMLRYKTAVEYVTDPVTGAPHLTSAALALASSEPGQVAELSFAESENRFRASILHDDTKVDVWTTDAVMQGILETAARETLRVDNLDFDPETFEIRRGKVNVELPPDK